MDAQELFGRHWVRWQPSIYAYIRSLVFPRADAEDVLQDVAEVLWRKIDRFEERTRFDQWAYRVARDVVLNHQKKAKRRRVVFSGQMTRQLADEGAETAAGTRQEVKALELCIGKPQDKHRELLSRRCAPGATDRSVAAQMGRSESVISRALSQIHQALTRCVYLALDGVTTDLGTFGGQSSKVLAINDARQIIGGLVELSGYWQPRIWQDGGIAVPGGLGGSSTTPEEVNNLGQVVGGSGTADGQWHAFLWEDGVMQDLNDCVPADSGWVLDHACAINDSGWICGYGSREDEPWGFLLVPVPEPSTSCLRAWLWG